MNMNQWLADQVIAPRKRAMPILSFPSISLLGLTVRELISDATLQAKGMVRIAERVPSAASVSMMDLSVEAEAFGCDIRYSDDDVPTVTGVLVHDETEANALVSPSVGAARTGRYIEAIGLACKEITDRPVLAGVIGPFSLAGRLMGVSEAMMNCIIEPDMVHILMRKCTDFLINYIRAYKAVGAGGVVLAEPLTGLLSPDLAAEFSTPYVRALAEAVQEEHFIIIYHNCGNNTLLMIDTILDTGCACYHFGNAIDMKEMLTRVPANIPVMGNIDPADLFKNGTPETIREQALHLMAACCPEHPNFIISSGCDIPPMSPWENIDAFFAAVDEYYHGINV